jgi:hypothetical protein
MTPLQVPPFKTPSLGSCFGGAGGAGKVESRPGSGAGSRFDRSNYFLIPKAAYCSGM